MSRSRFVVVSLVPLMAALFVIARADEPRNHAQGDRGTLPVGEDGEPLNLDFETGTLEDWTATGNAWADQPVKGEIAERPGRPFGEGKQSLHTGDWWLGGFEIHHDGPTGTLTSAAFEVTQPWASFLLGGGSHADTRVELVRAESDQVFFRISGVNQEEMRPVVMNLQAVKGQKIFIRIVDGNTGGWGHVNFDDFRLHAKRPRFETPVLEPVSTLATTEVYPHAGLMADEAAAAMQVPPGFSVQVAAAEPDVAQPIAMAIDDRGRLWIAEAFTYPQRAADGEGQDRIVILEDTDLDGTLDSRKVFAENLNLVSGLEVGFGGVWVGAAPYLAFIPDRNGNDVPDGLENESGRRQSAEEQQLAADATDGRSRSDDDSPSQISDLNSESNPDFPPGAEILLDGWHYEDTHETLNAFMWGPDGWLYGCHGVFTHSRVGKPGTPDEERQPLNAGVWRYHPVRHEFEVFAHGTSNPWGVDFDDWGQCFVTACVIPHLYHIVQEGRYQRQAGAHFNEFTYGDIQTIARHRHYVGNQWNDNDRKRSDDLGGGHAHAGAMFYLGGAWPEEYRNKLFMNNIHGNRLNVDQVWNAGSGYVGDRHPDFLLTGDQWSQMLYMTYGPDGQMWVIDWYDANQCHRPEEGAHDKTNGRVFRVAYNDARPVAVDLTSQSDVELALLVDSDNDWYVRHSRRLLMERSASGELSVEARDALRERLFPRPNGGAPLLTESDDPQGDARRLRALWALHVTGDHWLHDDVTMDQLLGDPSPWMRAWSVQLLFEELNGEGLTEDRIAQLASMAAEDPSPVVRLYLASLANRIAPAQRWSIVEGLIAHAEDAADHNLPLMYWYAMEPLAEENPQRALALGMSAGETIPVLRDYMIRRLGSGEPEESLKLLVGGLADAEDNAVRLSFLKGIRGLQLSNPGLPPPSEWDEVYRTLGGKLEPVDIDIVVHALGVSYCWGNVAAADMLHFYATTTDVDIGESVRREAFAFMRECQHPGLFDAISEILKWHDAVLVSDAIRAAATLEDPRVAELLLAEFSELSVGHRRDALGTLASRPTYATQLLAAVRDNRIPRDALSADLVRQLRNLDDPDLTQQIEQVWGVVRDTPEERLKLIAEYRAMLESPPAVEPDRAIFAKTCQQCHVLFGTGGKVGPDITGANRSQLDYLLQNIFDPSAVMAKEYRPSVIATEDGRVITGIVKEETDSQLTVQTANEVVVLTPDDVAARKESEKSMMPEDQLQPFSQHEVRSLFAYLSGAGQTPLRATQENVGTFFNGEDLEGWIGNGVEGRESSGNGGGASAHSWSVEEGEIVGRSSRLGHNEFLVSQLSLGDFRFACQVKLVDNEGNSGIQIRSMPQSNGEVRGYQCDIGPGWWGKLYEELGRGLLVDNDAEQHVQPGEWNHYEIVAVGSRVQTWINGQPCVDYSDPAGARRGVIAFQLHSGGPTEVRFKDMELTLLEPNPLEIVTGEYPGSSGGPAPGAITWKKTQLDDKFRGEGVAIADFNNDGRMDVASGSVWFEQKSEAGEQRPESGAASSTQDATVWTMHSVLEEPAEFNIDGYSESFMNWSEDLNGDGWLDLIVVDFPGKQTWWFENPGARGQRSEVGDGSDESIAQPWRRHQITPVTNNESPQYLDVDGDGRREIVFGGENGLMSLASPKSFPDAPWSHLPISIPGSPGTERFSHGLGIGDINGDGRKDVLIPNGWWEQPEDATLVPWTFHAAAFGPPCSQMYVFDFDGDGDSDVLSASPHDFGIWWHEQRHEPRPEGSGSEGVSDANESGPLPAGRGSEAAWTTHEIESEYSETHAVVLADINGDGLPDFVTGKRWWSHNGHGPGADGPAVLYWYELQRVDGKPTWTRHEIDGDSGVGTQFTVADINGDGLLDIATSNKKGTFVFEQLRVE